MSLEEQVYQALRGIADPESGTDIVSKGIVRDLRVEGGRVKISLSLESRDKEYVKGLQETIRAATASLPGVEKVDISRPLPMAASQAPPKPGQKAQSPFDQQQGIPGIRNIIAVGSGKGGVGKSTVAVNLALALEEAGFKVGLMDADIYGPSMPLMMGVQQTPITNAENKIIPLVAHNVKVMSIGFLIPEGTPLIWRGPILQQMIQQFLTGVTWGQLDYLVVDLPPGTGDVQLSLAQLVPITGAVMVTTPQDVALTDVLRGIAMLQKVNVPVIGIVENMSYFECPHCHQTTKIFSEGGGERASERLSIPLLGKIPLDPEVVIGGDKGIPAVKGKPASAQAEIYRRIAGAVAEACEAAAVPGARPPG